MKYALFLLSLVAILLAIVGYTQVASELGPLGSLCAQYIGNDASAYQSCVFTAVEHALTSNSTTLLVVSVAGILDLLVWVLGLIWTVMRRRWGWFVAIFLFSPLATLLYGLFGPDGSIFGRPGAAKGKNTPGFDALPNSVQAGLCWQCGGRVRLDSRICLFCGATQAHYEVGVSAARQFSGFDRDNAAGVMPSSPPPAPSPSWAPPPPGYQPPGMAPAMPSPGYQQDFQQGYQQGYQQDYQQSGYQQGYQQSGSQQDYQQSGYQQPGQPPASGGSGWGQGY